MCMWTLLKGPDATDLNLITFRVSEMDQNTLSLGEKLGFLEESSVWGLFELSKCSNSDTIFFLN